MSDKLIEQVEKTAKLKDVALRRPYSYGNSPRCLASLLSLNHAAIARRLRAADALAEIASEHCSHDPRCHRGTTCDCGADELISALAAYEAAKENKLRA